MEAIFQIGKNGITQGVIDSLNNLLKTHHQIRISLLKTATRDKEELLKTAKELQDKVNYKCLYRIIGFKIILKKQSNKLKKP